MYRRRSGCAGLLVGLLIIVLLLLVLGAYTGYGLGIGIVEATKTETGSVPISGAPTLDVENQIGKIVIQPSVDSSLTYSVTKHGWSFTSATAQGETDRMKFNVTQSGNSVTMKGEQAAGLLRFNIGSQNAIDIIVNVPHGSIVKVLVNAGQATIRNPDGALDVTANAGSIEVTGAKLGGPLSLHANAGQVNFSGAMEQASGANTVLANAGSVTMNLDPSAKYNLNVKADVGGVETDFSVPNGVQRAGTGATLIGTTSEGSGAAIPLQVTANTGSVKILKLKP